MVPISHVIFELGYYVYQFADSVIFTGLLRHNIYDGWVTTSQ